ncbi:30S ribosomal protein S18 [Egicoccus sp. AB-alg6-2]|uniref:30S ribosomal protein S18 n=1 Tax=Egicoccus sp. AB-alg6-2 TaxID=3242692 RepID=UPI00359E79F2
MPPKPKKDRKPRKDKPCPVCTQGIEYVDYKDLSLLKPFLNERAKIKARRTSGVCAQHQAQLSGAIKNAREMALIPYTSR